MAWHEWPSNFSGGQSVEGIGTWLRYSNSVTGGLLGQAIIFMVFAISFVTLKGYSTSKAFVASCFITTIIAILLARVITFNPIFLAGLIILTVISTLWVAFEKPAGQI